MGIVERLKRIEEKVGAGAALAAPKDLQDSRRPEAAGTVESHTAR
jgi:hypothetical protein